MPPQLASVGWNAAEFMVSCMVLSMKCQQLGLTSDVHIWCILTTVAHIDVLLLTYSHMWSFLAPCTTHYVLVEANIRGGGEYGPQWHQSALKANRNKCYEDFIAVGEHLVERKVCTPKTLACRGGSNGGLLTGNMLVQAPDLFGAIHIAVPLLDMQRYHKLLAGASWMAEYGNVSVHALIYWMIIILCIWFLI